VVVKQSQDVEQRQKAALTTVTPRKPRVQAQKFGVPRKNEGDA
jgi:hypothetical protein